MTFRVFNINQISVAVVAIFMQEWTSQMSTEETLLQPCTLYSQSVLAYSQKCCVFSPRCGFVNIFSATLLHFHLLSLSLYQGQY